MFTRAFILKKSKSKNYKSWQTWTSIYSIFFRCFHVNDTLKNSSFWYNYLLSKSQQCTTHNMTRKVFRWLVFIAPTIYSYTQIATICSYPHTHNEKGRLFLKWKSNFITQISTYWNYSKDSYMYEAAVETTMSVAHMTSLPSCYIN